MQNQWHSNAENAGESGGPAGERRFVVDSGGKGRKSTQY
jgi:hypothetical protein